MGVPKFFRYISERYPCLSQLVSEFEIPEFDNLYLDMNGIIHVCSHPNDFDPHFRITEEAIFTAIFHYIEFLFKTIKPQKLFFLAVDGVAPRAKINQQRGRRFRSAKEAEVQEADAVKKGVKLPDAPRFDSNCITPGTLFMDRLQQQLQYFISKKISEDTLWQKCTIILSGHQTPGEGEHKIMDYIRHLRRQPDYDGNTRHCLYGLDADLIMLGLCTHDPHFCLLREEVKYGRKAQKRIMTPEETRFYLLHLSLMREYLGYEFGELKDKLPFPFNLENIIDDWVLMGFLVGNDFIPHLPDLHINKGAFQVLYKAYIEVLPTLDGYLNENGHLNLKRFQAYLSRVAEFDLEQFEEKYADLNYLEEKTGHKLTDKEPKMMCSDVRRMVEEMEDLMEPDSDSDEDKDLMLQEFSQHKTHYYRDKMEYEHVTDDVLRGQAEGYIRAIQWNLHYYYHGCQSWSWFFPHHYSPFVSDITNFSDLELKFDMGKPFQPFHQLLAVLPPASVTLLPEAYRPLMTAEDSPIKDFYPNDFETDLNGKLQDWEAVVLLPFIQENRLIDAMSSCKGQLTDDEIRRNKHEPMQVFTYTPNSLGPYKSSMFPEIPRNHALVKGIWPYEIAVDPNEVVFGVLPNYDYDTYYPGFPSLRFVPHTSRFESAGVKVFDYASRGVNVVLTVKKEVPSQAEMLADKLGKVVYVGWPHMVKVKISSISDGSVSFKLNGEKKVARIYLKQKAIDHWKNESTSIKQDHLTKRGIELPDVAVIVYGYRMQGRKLTVSQDNSVLCTNVWSTTEQYFPLSTMVDGLKERQSDTLPKTFKELYPVDSKVILLAQPNYGALGIVMSNTEPDPEPVVKVKVFSVTDPVVDVEALLSHNSSDYMTGYMAAKRLSINQGVFARITGSCFLKTGDEKSVNIGLCLKYTKKNEEVPGYTRREGATWLYSDKTVELVNKYWEKFPEVFQFLNGNSAMDFTLEDIYGPDNGVGKDKEIVEWLKEQPHSNVAPVTCGAEIMSNEAIVKLESILNQFEAQKSTSVIKVKPTHLHKSDLIRGNIPVVPIKPQLMDRVVCSNSAFTVPLGLRGFIIGIHKQLVENDMIFDVLFDEQFPGGISLCCCSPGRAYRVPLNSIIDITAEQRSNSTFQLHGIPKNVPMDLRPEARRAWNSSLLQKNNSEPSAFASVSPSQSSIRPNKVEDTKPVTANGHPAPANQERFRALWEEMKRPEALIKALNINEKKESVQDMTGKSHCSALMSYFERSIQGLPKYDVFAQHGSLLANVQLPNGAVYWGVPCQTREAALENAALQALGGLGLTSLTKERSAAAEDPRRTSSGPPRNANPSNWSGTRQQGGYQQSHPQLEHQERARRPTQFYTPVQGGQFTRMFTNNARGAPQHYSSPGSNPVPAPDANLPMPPSNWRQKSSDAPEVNNWKHNQQPANQSSMAGTSKLPFVPLQAIISQKATRGLSAVKSKPVCEVPPKVVEKASSVQSPTANDTLKKNDTPDNIPKPKPKGKPRRIVAGLNWKSDKN